jgi:hypothetical protein
MARRLRIVRDGAVYHVLNRRVGRLSLFDDDGDFFGLWPRKRRQEPIKKLIEM